MHDIEAERRRLAQRLEQDIIRSLDLLQAQTETYVAVLRGNHDAEMALAVLSSLVTQAVQKARYLQTNLNPTILETLGLEPALEAYAADEGRVRGVQIQLGLQRLRDRLPSELEFMLFRAVQDLVDQGVEYASVSRVVLSLRQSERDLILEYRDNGNWSKPYLNIVHRLHQQTQAHKGRFTGTVQDSTLHVTWHMIVEQPISLTPRELEIVQHVAEGYTNKEIAAQLHLSARTINFHLDNVYSKLNVSTRTEAALYAVQHGWIDNPVK